MPPYLDVYKIWTFRITSFVNPSDRAASVPIHVATCSEYECVRNKNLAGVPSCRLARRFQFYGS